MQIETSPSRDSELLLAEVATEFFERMSRGESPKVEEYVQRYPQVAEVLRNTLPALLLVNDSLSGGSLPAGSLPAGSLPEGSLGGFGADQRGEKIVGDFRILHELGRGGMGVVYEAEQISMGGRRIALKVLPFAAMSDPRHLQRFHNEVRAAGSLDHPHVVSVYSVGQDRGVHFFAMRLIRGQSMATLIQELSTVRRHAPLSAESIREAISAPPSPTPSSGNTDPTEAMDAKANPESLQANVQRKISDSPSETASPHQALIDTKASTQRSDFYEAVADLGIQAAEALDHAHQRGVIHRDIKPGNLMIDAYSQLYITDFGLAHIEESVGMTMTGDLIGTLRYMSPEQAMGKRVVVDYRTDIYSLGVSLYELLATRPAFEGENRAELLKQIAFDEPQPLTQVDPSIPKDPETIVRKAMEKNPEERYKSAQDLADDLKAFRAFQPIKAKPPTILDRFRKFTRRNHGLVAAAMLILLLSTIGFAISNALIAAQRTAAENAHDAEMSQHGEADRQRAEADRQRADAEHQKAEAERHQRLAEAQSEALRTSLYVADVRLAAVDLISGNTPRMQNLLAKYVPEAGHDDLRDWEWYYLLGQCNQDEITFAGHTSQITEIAWSPIGRWLGTTGADGVKVWNVEAQTPHREMKDGPVLKRGATWSPDSRRFAWGSVASEIAIRIWDSVTDQVTVLRGHDSSVWSVAFSPDGQHIASTGLDGTCRLWDVRSNKCIQELSLNKHAGNSLAWSPDGNELCVVAGEEIVVWNPFSGDSRRTESQVLAFSCERYSSSGTLILAGDEYGNCSELDATTLELVRQFKAHDGPCSDIAIMDDQRFATCNSDALVHIWRLADFELVRTFRGHSAHVGGLDWNPSKNLLASASTDTTARMWDPSRAEGFVSLVSPNVEGRIPSKWFQYKSTIEPFGENAVLYRRPQSAPAMVRLGAGQELSGQQSTSVFDLREIPAGMEVERIIQIAADELERGSSDTIPPEVEAVLATSDAPGSLLWSPDRTTAIRVWYSDSEHHVEVWGLHETQVLFTLGPFITLRKLYWSPNGEVLYLLGWRAYAEEPSLFLFDARSGMLVHRLPIAAPNSGSNEGVDVCWNRDGSKIVVGSESGEVTCWNAITGKKLASSQTLQSSVASLAWSPNGNRIAVSGSDRTVRILDATSLDELLSLDDAQHNIAQLYWCHDGKSLVGRSFEGEIVLWDGRSGYERMNRADYRLGQLYGEADRAMSDHEYERVLRIYEKIRVERPNDANILYRLSFCYFKQTDYQQAVEAASDLVEIDSSDPSAWRNRASLHSALGEPEKAISDATEGILRAEHDDIELCLLLDLRLENHAELGNWRDALADCAQLIRSPYTDYEEDYRYAVICMKSEPEAYGDACLSMLAESANSQDAEECHFAAWSCALGPNAIDDYSPALALAGRAVDESPTSANFRNTLGAVLMRAGKYDEAKATLEKALDVPENASASRSYTEYFLAMTAFHLGDLESAVKYLQIGNEHADAELSEKPPWNRKLTLELLRDEAEALIRRGE